jgi:alanine dehydrogenase
MASSIKIAILESVKPDEHRLPLHPKHMESLSNKCNIFFQENYGRYLDVSKEQLIKLGFFVEDRDSLLETADIIFLLKPTDKDLLRAKEGATIVGWCHTVQQQSIAKIARERKLTLIAMENMYRKNKNDESEHIFYKNNIIAGKVGIQHALANTPKKYQSSVKIAVIGFGLVSHGVIEQLFSMGYENISIFTRKPANEVTHEYEKIQVQSLKNNLNELLNFDIIINGLKQDVLNPYDYFTEKDLAHREGILIVDISCDDKIGFDFSQETSIEKPILNIGDNYYYAVPNIPSLVWQDISYDISENLLPLINSFSSDEFPEDLKKSITSATDIRKGSIINSKITAFQELRVKMEKL